MGLDALALVLAAAVLHAVWNLVAKRVDIDPIIFVWFYVVGSLVVWGPVAVVWVLVTADRPQWSWLAAGAGTALLHTIYQLVLQRGYVRGDLNVVYPVARGTGPLLTFLVAVTVLGESPKPSSVIGVVAVLAGVLVIATGPRPADGPGAGQPERSHRPAGAGVAWGVATGVSIAAYTLWDDHAVNDVGVSPLPYFVLGLALQIPLLTLLMSRRPGPLGTAWRQARPAVITVAVLSPAAYVLVLRAMQLAPVSLVAPTREVSIVIGALLSWWVLHEPRPARRLVGAVTVVSGIAAIVIG